MPNQLTQAADRIGRMDGSRIFVATLSFCDGNNHSTQHSVAFFAELTEPWTTLAVVLRMVGQTVVMKTDLNRAAWSADCCSFAILSLSTLMTHS